TPLRTGPRITPMAHAAAKPRTAPPEGEAAATRARKLPAEGDKSLTGSRASVAGVAVLRPYEPVLALRQRLMPQRSRERRPLKGEAAATKARKLPQREINR